MQLTRVEHLLTRVEHLKYRKASRTPRMHPSSTRFTAAEPVPKAEGPMIRA